MNVNIKRLNLWLEVKDYIYITLGLLLYTVGVTVFILPYEIVTGGVTGLAAIVFYVTKIPIQYTYFSINVLLLIVALKVLGWKFMAKTVYAICSLSVMLWAAQKVIIDDSGAFIKILGEGQDFMSIIIGCAIIGTGIAIAFLHNGSTGGTDIVAAIINKYHNYSIGQAMIAVDCMIICSCLFIPYFGDMVQRWHKIVFGLCTMGVECFTLDYVMNVRRESVQFLIFSNKWQEIAYAIGTQLDRGITILDGHGWYTGQQRKVLCVLMKRKESIQMLRVIKMIDPNAFVSQSSVIGTYGEGFDQIKVSVKNKQRKKLARNKQGTNTVQT